MFDNLTHVQMGARTVRASSWDRTGGNNDWFNLAPGSRTVLLDIEGPGKLLHFYWTSINASVFQWRQLVLRAWWDGEATPSIEAPIGDLFCVPHCRPIPVQSLMAVVNPGSLDIYSWGLNLYWPMPFNKSARLELAYDPLPGVPADTMLYWYHIDLERYSQPFAENVGRFHAQWRRENPTTPKAGTKTNDQTWGGHNSDGRENYVALEAQGAGQMVGIHLQVDNLGGGWYGEGDDMVFIDGQPGEQWPPTLPGTGSEEIFGGGAGPNYAYVGPYTGFHLVENPDYAGKNAMYRWYLADPIRFERSLTWTIEHGHDNNYANDYASVAYWYQLEPHAAFPPLPAIEHRLPRVPDSVLRADAARARCKMRLDELQRAAAGPDAMRDIWQRFNSGGKALREGRFEEAVELFREPNRQSGRSSHV